MTEESENIQDALVQIAFVRCPVYLLPKEDLEEYVDETIKAIGEVGIRDSDGYKHREVINIVRGYWLSVSGESSFENEDNLCSCQTIRISLVNGRQSVAELVVDLDSEYCKEAFREDISNIIKLAFLPQFREKSLF